MSTEEDGRQLPSEVNGEVAPAAPALDAEVRRETERLLGAFAPRAPLLQRERLLALVSGSVQPTTVSSPMAQLRTPWYWPAATAALAVTSLSLALVLAVRLSTEPVVKVEYRDRMVDRDASIPAGSNGELAASANEPYLFGPPSHDHQGSENGSSTTASDSPMIVTTHSDDNYLRDRRVALAQGVDAVAHSRSAAKNGGVVLPATQQELLRQLIPMASLRPAAALPNWLDWPTGQ